MALITIGGPKNARTNPDGLRFYTWDGIEYPSVTTIRRMAGMPFGLHNWALNQVINRAVDQLPDLNRMVTNNDEATLKVAKSWLRRGSTEARDAAADLGTRVHDAAATGKKIGDVSEDIVPFLRQYLNWIGDTNVEILQSERQVWNLEYGYAGTFDGLVRFPNGDTYIIDLKTGKSTYPEHAIQAVAYAMADFVGEDNVRDDKATAQLLNATGIALLHLRPEGWTWQVIHVTPELYDAFKGLLAFAMWAHKYQDMLGLIEAEASGHA